MELPHSIEAERAALGCALLDREAAEGITHALTADDFYRPEHAKVHRAICALVERGMEVDALTLRAELPKMQPGYPLDLQAEVTTTSAWKSVSNVLRSLSRRRAVIKLSERMKGLALECEDSDALLDTLETETHELSGRRLTGRVSEIGAVIDRIDLSERIETFRSAVLPDAWMQRGQLVVIGARQAVGKSALAAQLSHEFAERHVKSRIWSYEMNSEQYARRLIQHRTGFGFVKQMSGMAPHEIEYAQSASQGDWRRFITVDDSNPSLTQLCRQIHRAAREGVSLIFIDHLHILADGSDRRAVTKATRELKLAANDSRLTGDTDRRPVVVLLAQFTRLEKREDGTFSPPTIQSFKESGSIEADADIAVLLHQFSRESDLSVRERLIKSGHILEFDATHGDGSKELGFMEVAKNRYGKTGKTYAWFDGEEQRWSIVDQQR